MVVSIIFSLERIKYFYLKIMAVPIVFLGIGLYRAWITALFNCSVFPGLTRGDYMLFEGTIGVASLLIAALSPWLAPLWKRRSILLITLISAVGGVILLALGTITLTSTALKYIGTISTGFGCAILILLWAEFFGSLNPLRVALYHALAIFFGESLRFLFAGMSSPYLIGISLFLPVLSLYWLLKSMERIPQGDLPKARWETSGSTFPWKVILLMSVVTFATGFGFTPEIGRLAGNYLGIMIVTGVTAIGVLSVSKYFNLGSIYQIGFPVLTVVLLLIMPNITINPQVMAFCYEAGYVAMSMLIMVVLSNITYRFGTSAALVSGVERGLRYVFEVSGWGLQVALAGNNLLSDFELPIRMLVMTVCIITFVATFVSEKDISSIWNVNINDTDGTSGKTSPAREAMRVADLSELYGLTQRESEVLLLLVRHKPVYQIEKELFIAQGTLKAHISHIYSKMDVHSRKELFALIGVE